MTVAQAASPVEHSARARGLGCPGAGRGRSAAVSGAAPGSDLGLVCPLAELRGGGRKVWSRDVSASQEDSPSTAWHCGGHVS